MIRPSGPLPCSCAMSIPFSRASRRASGEAFTRPSPRAVARRLAQPRSPPQPPGRARAARPSPARRRPRSRRSSCSSTAAAPLSASARAAGAGAVPGGDVLALVADEGDRAADLDLAGVDDDLEQDAVGLGLDLLRHLVRVELVERLALLDRLEVVGAPEFDVAPRDTGVHRAARAAGQSGGAHARFGRGRRRALHALGGAPPRPRLRDRRRRDQGRRSRPAPPARASPRGRRAGRSPTSSRPRSARRCCATSRSRSGAPGGPRRSPCSSRCSSAARRSAWRRCTTRTRSRSRTCAPATP